MQDAQERMTWEEFLQSVGRPFRISLATTANTTDNEFILASTDYDWNGDGTDETAPFANYTLVITGIHITQASATGTFRTSVDARCIDVTTVSSATIDVDISGQYNTVGEAMIAPNCKNVFGMNLMCRSSFKFDKNGATGAAGTVVVTGYAVPQAF